MPLGRKRHDVRECGGWTEPTKGTPRERRQPYLCLPAVAALVLKVEPVRFLTKTFVECADARSCFVQRTARQRARYDTSRRADLNGAHNTIHNSFYQWCNRINYRYFNILILAKITIRAACGALSCNHEFFVVPKMSHI